MKQYKIMGEAAIFKKYFILYFSIDTWFHSIVAASRSEKMTYQQTMSQNGTIQESSAFEAQFQGLNLGNLGNFQKTIA